MEKVARKGSSEFSPGEALGLELYTQIKTLPESIGKLKKVRKIWLYGSKLQRIPPEIGQMEALEYFDVYTSYDLQWLPYEIMYCKRLKDSRISTRALYGNYKNRMAFPSLQNNPVRYEGETLHCSVCKKEMTYQQTNQMWISLNVATDVLPLLVNLCSQECEASLPKPHPAYVPFAHKGGAELVQPTEEEYYEYLRANGQIIKSEDLEKERSFRFVKPLKLIKKIWKK
ncbi:MAG: leucine-rich repeat domain-containing protein [Flavisolibacter sp.]|nr:leucine-rich repeat domain-containing protein [Flavisolibacter sp.]